ncbi:MAG: hypothetical protein OXE85_09365 [Roseovarius sp.]|nr:hypothetical protein [Roseovarius sp.]MCY4317360.1 hypothetical protein [Roseovarius sp.]
MGRVSGMSKDGVRAWRENRTLERLRGKHVMRTGERVRLMAYNAERRVNIIELRRDASDVMEFEIASRGTMFDNA